MIDKSHIRILSNIIPFIYNENAVSEGNLLNIIKIEEKRVDTIINK